MVGIWILTHANSISFSNYFRGRFCNAIHDNAQIHARIKLNIKSNNKLIELKCYNIILSATRYHCMTVYADLLSERQWITLINVAIMELHTVYIKHKYKRHTQHFIPQKRLWKCRPPLIYENANTVYRSHSKQTCYNRVASLTLTKYY
jgi:hypothetical protein